MGFVHVRIKRFLQPATVYNQNQIPAMAHSCKHQEWHSYSIGSALCSSWISTVTANNHYILTHWSRWWRLAHRYFPWPARPADLFIEYAFFIDFAERSCSYSGVECPTHSHQSLVESQGHRRGWPHSSCDLLHDGTARDAKLLIEESNLEPYLQLGESKSRVSIVPL